MGSLLCAVAPASTSIFGGVSSSTLSDLSDASNSSRRRRLARGFKYAAAMRMAISKNRITAIDQ